MPTCPTRPSQITLMEAELFWLVEYFMLRREFWFIDPTQKLAH